MPDKRQTSKQRRAARNRAAREALIARRENAQAEREQARQAAPARASASAGGGRAAAGASKAAAGDGQPAPGIAGALYRRPPGTGDTAVLMALFFAVLAAGLSVYVAFTSEVIPVDHAGEPLGRFPAISRQAYAIATGTDPATEKVSLIDAYGPVMAIFAVLPALILVGVFISHRREVRSRPLTFGLVALALVSVFNGFFAIYFLPSLVALAVAGFQVRKVELPARQAARGARGRPGAAADDADDDVIDVEEVDEADVDDADLDETDVDETDGDDDDVIDVEEAEEGDEIDAAADEGDEDDDVLDDLEAELDGDEAGEEAEAAEAETGTGRGRRRGAGGRSSRR